MLFCGALLGFDTVLGHIRSFNSICQKSADSRSQDLKVNSQQMKSAGCSVGGGTVVRDPVVLPLILAIFSEKMVAEIES